MGWGLTTLSHMETVCLVGLILPGAFGAVVEPAFVDDLVVLPQIEQGGVAALNAFRGAYVALQGLAVVALEV